MGKLFWKFFFGFWLCLITAATATGTALYFMHDKPSDTDLAEGPRAQFLLESTQAILEGKGSTALYELLNRNRLRAGHPAPVFAVSETGTELLNRPVPPNVQLLIQAFFSGQNTAQTRLQPVTAPDNTRWVLFIPKINRPNPPPAHSPAFAPAFAPFPTPVLLSALIASVLFAALLAHTFSSPLTRLKNAFHEAGKGRLGIRISGTRKRNDEIGQLLTGFDHMAGQIETQIRQQQSLLHDVSHELRSPLARLSLAAGLARQNPAQLESSLSRIEAEAERLDHLIGELLDLSRLEAHPAPGNLHTHNVIELLTTVLEDAQFEAQQHNKHIVFTTKVDQWLAPCEPETLQRAFENVIRNAIRYTPTGSAVEIACSRQASNQLQIQITDHGPGVEQALLTHLFTPFFKHGAQSGHGLGLAIAQKVILRHRGHIQAQNGTGGGLVVTIDLPLVS